MSNPATAAADDDPTGASNRTQSVVSGGRWGALTQLTTFVSRYVVSIVLARFLVPDDYGVVILGMTFVSFLDIFKDMGTVIALIQRKEVDQRLLSTMFFTNIAVGVVMSVLFGLLLSVLRPDHKLMMATLGSVLLVSSFGMVQQALMRRNLAFRSLAKVSMVQPIVNGAISIVLAVAGAGAWALVFGQLGGAAASVIAAWAINSWRPSFEFSRDALRSVAGFSSNLTLFNVFNWAFLNGDKVLVGRVLGDNALGIYGFGQRILFLPVQAVTSELQKVLMPTFARLQDDHAAIGRGYLRACGAITALTAPLMLGFTAVAGPFVVTVYGDRWIEAVPIATILAPIGMLHSLHFTVGPIYAAKGRTDLLLRWGVFSGLFTFAGYVLGLVWGIQGVATVYAITIVLITYHAFAIPFRLIDLEFRSLVRAVLPYVVSSTIMTGIVYAVRRGLEAAGASDAVVLLCCTAVGMVIYGSWLVVAKPPAAMDLVLMVRRKSGRRSGGKPTNAPV